MRKLLLFDVDGLLLEPASTRRLPGAAEALAQLRHAGDAVLAVLCADAEPAARQRITRAGLERYLDLAVGAYGVGAADRTAAVAAARQRATEGYGCPFEVLVVATGGVVTDGTGTERAVDGLLDVVPLARGGAR
ncbi:hypothetical protein [Plantactinospora sp. KBS50]|uniref:hypothetical protein n=1 Tax=Plantactinospora sp. KBS50 TaxID=2024580 RepID=UPI000BAAF240|nr:hypothetical protein [Plantactinospora sp. KBS50]ASW56757.1 hypothetical protein CIK06_25275 [Plantactinospora sp. KBS50]